METGSLVEVTIRHAWQIRLLGRDASRKHQMFRVGCLLASRGFDLDLPKSRRWVVLGGQDLSRGDHIQLEGLDISPDLRSQLIPS